jgi:hypothetical protein
MDKRLYAPETLSRPARIAFDLWASLGPEGLSRFSRPTKYRYRKEVLAATGVDILLLRSEQAVDVRAELLRVEELQAREVTEYPAPIQRLLWNPP